MITWQTVVIVQVFFSALPTILARKLALADQKLFFMVGVVTYGVIAAVGATVSLTFGPGTPQLPPPSIWPYLIAIGSLIPASWLLQYKIVHKFGASNGMLIAMLNHAGTATLGFVLLQEPLSSNFLIGCLLIAVSILIAFRIQPDKTHHVHVPITIKLLLVLSMVVAYSFGMFAEKQAVTAVGVWDYIFFGWLMQFLGSLVLLMMYGRKELSHVSLKSVRKAMAIGALTSIAGMLYIYALSIGTLSHTIIATSGKVALVMVLAALLLNERNSLGLRITALMFSVTGLLFLTSF